MSIPRDQRYGKGRPCPGCGHEDPWCFRMRGGDAFWCGRAATTTVDGKLVPGRPHKGGWIHQLAGQTTTRVAQIEEPKISRNWEKFVVRWQRAILGETIESIARQLGVSADSLRRLGIGFATTAALKVLKTECSRGGAFTFPMVDGRGQFVGVRLRSPSGYKFAVSGSDGSGLFVPAGIPTGCDLVAPEGPTSLAAVLSNNIAAVGRPNCRAGVEYLRKLCERLNPRSLVLLGDNDAPDKRGRRAGQESVRELCAQLRGAAPSVRAALPPAGFKDARGWLQSGCDPKAMADWLGVQAIDQSAGRASA